MPDGPDVKKSVSQEIREARIDLGMTQPELADAIGVEARTVQRWENGRSRPNAQSQALLREELGIDLEIDRTTQPGQPQKRSAHRAASVPLEEAMGRHGEAWADLEVWRIRNGYSYTMMADALDIHRVTYSTWVSERHSHLTNESTAEKARDLIGHPVAFDPTRNAIRARLHNLTPWRLCGPGLRLKWLRMVLGISSAALSGSAGVTTYVVDNVESSGSRRSCEFLVRSLGFPSSALDANTLDDAILMRSV